MIFNKKFLLILFFLFSSLYSAEEKLSNAALIKPIIILDPGHGGLDRGAKIRYPYLEEKKLTLNTILLTKKFLEQYGYKVYLTRDKDYFVPLKKRAEKANDLNAEIFAAVHFNSCPNKLANGIEIYYHDSSEKKSKTKLSKILADTILKDMLKTTDASSRGVRKADFVVIRDTNMPSILIEVGFLTNPNERDRIRKKIYLEKVALGITEGIDNFIKKNM
jgi:N-acetylmuramoyl-L-alanine amidase